MSRRFDGMAPMNSGIFLPKGAVIIGQDEEAWIARLPDGTIKRISVVANGLKLEVVASRIRKDGTVEIETDSVKE